MQRKAKITFVGPLTRAGASPSGVSGASFLLVQGAGDSGVTNDDETECACIPHRSTSGGKSGCERTKLLPRSRAT